MAYDLIHNHQMAQIAATSMEVEPKCAYCQHEIPEVTQLGFELCRGCNGVLSLRKTTQAPPRQNVYVYLRVSTKQQNNDPLSGLFIQLRQCIEYCFDNNLNCFETYRDTHSAWNMRNGGLRGLRQMLEDMGFEIYFPKKCRSTNPLVKKLRQSILAAKELLLLRTEEVDPESHVDYILVANIDRFGRDVKNLLSIKHQLAEYNTRIVSVCQHILSGTETGDFSFHREALEAELFSRDRSMRIKSVKRAKKALGNYLGGCAPFGFTVNHLNGRRILVRSPEEQETIRLIEEAAGTGRLPEYIATQLNQTHRLRRQHPWTASKVSYILAKRVRDLTQSIGDLSI